MNEDSYIRFIIAKYQKKDSSISYALKTAMELYPIIRNWARPHIIRIEPIGSFKKGTGIIGTTDIDLLLSFPSWTKQTLQEIYQSLSGYLGYLGYSVREQNVSINVSYKNVSIDLVPAKRQLGSTYDHSIYLRKSTTWIKTSVHKHIVLIRGSGCGEEIRAMKIWRNLHSLEFPSFCLEMSIIMALKRHKKLKISLNLLRIFEYLANEFENARIEDPSNSNNIISDDLSIKEKRSIAGEAFLSFSSSSWDQVLW